MWLNPDTTARNLAQNPFVSFAIDEYAEDWRKTRGIQATGEAEVLLRPDEVSRAVELFAEKFHPSSAGMQPGVSFFRLSPSDIQFIEGSEGNGRDQEIGVDYPRDAVYSVFGTSPSSDLYAA